MGAADGANVALIGVLKPGKFVGARDGMTDGASEGDSDGTSVVGAGDT